MREKINISLNQIGLLISLFVIISGVYLTYSSLHDIDLTHNALINGYYYDERDIGSNIRGRIEERSFTDIFIEGMRKAQLAMLTLIIGGIAFGYFLNFEENK